MIYIGVRFELRAGVQDLRQPLQLQREVRRLHLLLSRLGQAGGTSFSLATREAMTALTSGNAGPSDLGSRIAAWLVETLVVDASKTGVYMAPAKWGLPPFLTSVIIGAMGDGYIESECSETSLGSLMVSDVEKDQTTACQGRDPNC